MNTKEIFKDFLRNNQYHVMHETDPNDSNLENFFVFFQMKDINNISKTKERPKEEIEIILTYLNSFQEHSKMQNLSNETIQFLNKHKHKLIYIPLLSLDKNHHFYLKRKKELEDNYENFLSIRMIGEPADPHKHFNYNIDSKLSDLKDISLGTISFAKDVVQEKAPVIKKGLMELGSKLSSKIKSLKK